MTEAVATIFLGIVGLWIGNNYRRQMRNALTPQSLEAYARLWQITGIANPAEKEVLDRDQRKSLADKLARWYFEGAGGMYLPPPTRILFFTIIHNLKGEVGTFLPETSRSLMQTAKPGVAEHMRGCICRRQMSILRTQMKNDLTLYRSVATFNGLRTDERDLLFACGIRPGFGSLPLALITRPTRSGEDNCLCRKCPP